MKQIDARLLRKIKNGDRDALEMFLQDARPWIAALAKKITPCGRRLYEDLIQAGYEGMMKMIPRYDENSGVQVMTYAVPWIIGEMRKVIRETIRHEQTEWTAGDDEIDRLSALHEHVCRENEENWIRKLWIREAIERLPDKQKQLIRLRYEKELTQAEAARYCMCSQSTISKIERTALEGMRSFMEDTDGKEGPLGMRQERPERRRL